MTDIALTLPARARTAATRKSSPVSGAHGAGSALGFIAGGVGKMVKRMARRPMRALVQLGVVGIGGLIIVNALSLQTARHPALTAARSQGSTADMVSDRPSFDRPPLPPVRPVELAAALPTTTPPSREMAAAPVRSQAPAPAASGARNGDPIGDLLRGEAPRNDAQSREPARPVMAAQRALARLGYTQVKPDGVAGEATKSAIERFERERKLPVTGQLNPRTMRELAAASGMKLD
ncbi:MAG: peptidoglycan-binding domain-containing protein [Bosea sp. (in: a-proteobacteria)]